MLLFECMFLDLYGKKSLKKNFFMMHVIHPIYIIINNIIYIYIYMILFIIFD